ncbi:MAG: PaaX family transcriptional regulator C-terminal domain-containing protein [Armatimonadota bacterium]|nr:PaaX family transcriptional regulator C-terminal domain-containing protein [Armatimonadota bacterium]
MKARSMLFTIFGDSVRYYGGEISTGSLIRLMGELGFSPGAVRVALARMARQGWVKARREGRRSFYALTERGRKRIEYGTHRVYSLRHGPWDGLWRILSYSFPEARRGERDRLRRELIWLGMGPLANGTWITPHNLIDYLKELVTAHGIQEYVILFTAKFTGPGGDKAVVQRCWNLERIARWHQAFIRTFKPRFLTLQRRFARGNPPPDNFCFVEKVRLVHEYRKSLFVDPWLPDDLLPKDWVGYEAAKLFFAYYQLLAPRARAFFEKVFEPPPGWTPPKAPVDPFQIEAATPQLAVASLGDMR